jgi:hypothetical protein
MIRRTAYRWRPQREAEEDIHAAIIGLLRAKADPRTIWYHPANGMHADPIHVSRFKRLGLLPGVADICLTLPGGRSAFLEVKSKDGRQSEAQKNFQLWCELNGAPYCIVKSLVEADAVLSEWGAYRVTVGRAA